MKMAEIILPNSERKRIGGLRLGCVYRTSGGES